MTMRINDGLDLDVVQTHITSLCQTVEGQKHLHRFYGGCQLEEVKASYRLQTWLREILGGEKPDLSGMQHFESMFSDKRARGLWVGAEWVTIIRTLRSCRQAFRRFKDWMCSAEFVLLANQSALTPSDVTHIDMFLDDLTQAIDSDGFLKDDASPELFSCRSKIRQLRQKIYAELDRISEPFKDKDILMLDEPTLRQGRYVLAVKAGFQNRIKGLIHDTSQTDQTVYIEPNSICHLGNEMKLLQSECEQIEGTLWLMFSEMFVDNRDVLCRLQSIVGLLDTLLSYIGFSERYECRQPNLGDTFTLVQARSPILLISHPNQTTSPIDAALSRGRGLMISGQNAGGKTASLKTIGVIAYLVSIGCEVPVGEQSVIPVFEHIGTMIGDGQSLASGLSSLQADVVRFNQIVEYAQSAQHTLVLLDEPCGNTEPEAGSALALSMTEELLTHDVFLVCTTHYARLKQASLARPELFQGAAVYVDDVNRQKHYRLVLDDIGESAPFDVARASGILPHVVKRAEALMSGEKTSAEDLLAGVRKLEIEKQRHVREAQEEAVRVNQQLAALVKDRDNFHQQKKEVEKKVRAELREELKKARALMSEAVRAHQQGASMEVVNKLNQALSRAEKETDAKLNSYKVESSNPAQKDEQPTHVLKSGARVHVDGFQNAVFEVVEVKDGQLLLQKGPIQIRKNISDIHIVESAQNVQKRKQAKQKGQPSRTGAKTAGITPRNKNNTLDLRGKRVEEAEDLLEQFADKAVKGNWDRIFILHGHGTGALRRWLHAEPASRFFAKKMYKANDADGGAAYTVLEF